MNVNDRLVGRQLGRFRIASLIGRGGMSAVYRAFDLTTNTIVALKILPVQLAMDPVQRERFQRETMAVSRLKHPNIVSAVDFGEIDGFPYIALPFIPGGSLRELINTGPLDPKLAASIGRDVAQALTYAEEAGVIHRDVKPGNVLLAADRSAMLSDFGIARLIELTTGFTKGGANLGTAAYMSPEQVQSLRITGKSDVYSLGATLFESLTGLPPFSAESAIGILYRHVTTAPPRPTQLVPGIPEDIEAIVLACLSKSPSDRPSAPELAELLSGFLRSRDAPLPAAAKAPPPAAKAIAEAKPAPTPGGSTAPVSDSASLDRAEVAAFASLGFVLAFVAGLSVVLVSVLVVLATGIGNLRWTPWAGAAIAIPVFGVSFFLRGSTGKPIRIGLMAGAVFDILVAIAGAAGLNAFLRV